ncbi:TetR/AcrR family transcriptional regulator C-terminal domain-containing protein [Sphaerisporangium fuscum]|uniref:TetR/AcrR family transcriptional regulator C-terminal domain-containing protein n=1 Tax=Sphaerisporangium fuscum TaxID=2835868 RepID=UPI0027E22885|nr:TetR/AcrR family transcriptional regulator C-terminal domain-containing protein [Sphaerisporangium fuscum]
MAEKIDPPYLRIVDDIRRRIASGELAPGDPVPSTRRIAREWDVALATATKALSVLRHQGLVQAVPRVGTVVTGPAEGTRRRTTSALVGPARPAEHQELTRERVVRAATEIADAEGLAALSMRGVAARLGVAAMTPYRYVDGKDELVLLMADAAYGEESYPDDPPHGWRESLALAARKLWAVHRRHPWLAQVTPLTRPLLLPNLMVYAEWALRVLDGQGLDPKTALDVHVLFYSYVQSIAVNLEWAVQAEATTGLSEDEWMERQTPMLEAITSSGRYPTFTRIIGSLEGGYDLRLDDLFEFGLEPMLDALALLIEGHSDGPKPESHP